MRNSKDEFIREVGNSKIICAKIAINPKDYNNIQAHEYIILRKNFSIDELKDFLENLDIEYNERYETQNLCGIILCEDGIWFERYKYHRGECWIKHCKPMKYYLNYIPYPNIPKECI